MPKRYMRGDRAFKSLIKRLPDVVRNEMVVQLNLTGKEELAKEQALAPVKTGALKDALSYRVLPSSLKLKVGLLGKSINRRIFYAWFIEAGRKAGGRGIKRGTAKYSSGVGKRLPKHFVYTTQRSQLYEPFRNIWDRALSKASSGVSDE